LRAPRGITVPPTALGVDLVRLRGDQADGRAERAVGSEEDRGFDDETTATR
jgi:hypothetical protein